MAVGLGAQQLVCPHAVGNPEEQLAMKEGVRFRRRLRVQRTGSRGRSPNVEIFGQSPRHFSGKERLADPQVLLFWERLLPTFRQQQLWE